MKYTLIDFFYLSLSLTFLIVFILPTSKTKLFHFECEISIESFIIHYCLKLYSTYNYYRYCQYSVCNVHDIQNNNNLFYKH